MVGQNLRDMNYANVIPQREEQRKPARGDGRISVFGGSPVLFAAWMEAQEPAAVASEPAVDPKFLIHLRQRLSSAAHQEANAA